MSLTAKTTTGILWNFGQQLATRGVGVLITLLLARFLVPEDFGLVAMMAVFLALGSSLMESGFREALIRLENVTQQDYDTAFYANLLLGLFSYGVLFLSAPAIAYFYEEPKLIELIRVASLTIIIMSFQVVQVASLSRKLNFKAQLKASLPASMISGTTSVYLAYIDYGVWAIVSQTLLNAFIQTALLWKVESWRPTLEFSWSSVKAMYNFGYKLFFSGVLDIVFQNLYVIVIAKVFSTYVAGLYFFANTMKELIVQQLVRSIQAVTYPALASVQHDNVRLKQGYKKIVILMTMILFSGVLFTAALAEPVFQILLPDKWSPAIPFFQLLCIASLMMPLHSISLNILKVKGRSDLFLYLEVIKKTINGLVLLATFRYGVYEILTGQIITSFINFIPNSYFSSKLLGYGIKEQIRDFLPILVITAVVASMGWNAFALFSSSMFAGAIFSSILMVVVYVISVFVFQREAFDLSLSFLKQFSNRKKVV
ncbi:lipopolysaccharide biosynthesis protein [Paraglaciecola sp. MB-3u-78]|jgi:O-antigen/teichoic acid export membrane protein|uniref:lipopolysaccharide biosynthesis protein n=1 Tax=Paraglaciecola sp. MB-3u-78 TaxID=2058332 RepID=UPI000C3392F3|nr:lipopolysaccharide biosynthesis protein [Paraglaciecola sp. MB-3u-78]PKG93137.1 flippase [Paraglaciecola sp. MB-3u-78]